MSKIQHPDRLTMKQPLFAFTLAVGRSSEQIPIFVHRLDLSDSTERSLHRKQKIQIVRGYTGI